MRATKLRVAIGAVAALALAVPAAAFAHPSLYFSQVRIAVPPEVQTITISNATGGTFRPSAAAWPVAYNAPAYVVQASLASDPAIGTSATGQSNARVSGSPGGPYTLTFQGASATANVNQVAPDGSGLTGSSPSVVAATTTQGAGPAITYTTDPSGASMPTVTRAIISNDGYVTQWTEANGLTSDGWLNLTQMPGAYRAPMNSSQWINYGPAQTGIQTHATCQNVPALNTEANRLAVQPFAGQNPVGDPFWNYVPWQKTSSGLGDVPTEWIPVVQSAVGVNLNSLDTVSQFRTACEALNGGQGVYVPADTQGGNQASAAIADAVAAAVAPLNAQIATLNGQVTTLTGERDAALSQVAGLMAEKQGLQNALAAAQATNQALVNRPLEVTRQSRRFSGRAIAMVTGRAGDTVTVTLRLANARSLGLSSPVIATVRRTIGSQGATLVTLNPNRAAARALNQRRRPVAVTIRAVSGTATDSVSATLTR